MSDEKELRELDLFCAEKVMGWTAMPGYRNVKAEAFHPTTNDADAMAVFRKCGEKYYGSIAIHFENGEWSVGQAYEGPNAIKAKGPTLPLAICLFAKRLFEK